LPQRTITWLYVTTSLDKVLGLMALTLKVGHAAAETLYSILIDIVPGFVNEI